MVFQQCTHTVYNEYMYIYCIKFLCIKGNFFAVNPNLVWKAVDPELIGSVRNHTFQQVFVPEETFPFPIRILILIYPNFNYESTSYNKKVGTNNSSKSKFFLYRYLGSKSLVMFSVSPIFSGIWLPLEPQKSVFSNSLPASSCLQSKKVYIPYSLYALY
jgi:hypothetical protein